MLLTSFVALASAGMPQLQPLEEVVTAPIVVSAVVSEEATSEGPETCDGRAVIRNRFEVGEILKNATGQAIAAGDIVEAWSGLVKMNDDMSIDCRETPLSLETITVEEDDVEKDILVRELYKTDAEWESGASLIVFLRWEEDYGFQLVMSKSYESLTNRAKVEAAMSAAKTTVYEEPASLNP